MSETKKEGAGRGSRLAVTVDGVALPDEEARAMWAEFSAHMDANRGDADGFARQKGYVSARPEFVEGRAVLALLSVEAPPAPAKAPQGARRGKAGPRRRR